MCSKILLLVSVKKGAIPIPTLQLKSSTFICLASSNSRIGLFPQRRELLRHQALSSNPLCKLICLLMLMHFFPYSQEVYIVLFIKNSYLINLSITHHFLALLILVGISLQILSMPFYYSVMHF